MHTERLVFRQWSTEDLPHAIAVWGNPAVTRLIADLGNPSEEQARERLAVEIANQSKWGVSYWPVFLRDGELVGCCGLRPYQGRVYEVGVHLLPKHWGKGFASEAFQKVIVYAFTSLAAEALFARHHPENGSGRVLRKLGFRYTHDELMGQTGLLHPCYRLEGVGPDLPLGQ
jgi:ribosomal-protein-alanine N-acetyltransferase